MRNRLFLAIVIALIAVGCTNKDVYFQYNPVSSGGWSQDTLYVFHVPIQDTSASYNVYINVRNTGNYPYQNLWLFLKKTSPDQSQTKDSIECYLADQRGKWLGTGVGSILEMPILYQQNIKFAKAGIYDYKIGQGMRDTLLFGINDIGIRVEKAVK